MSRDEEVCPFVGRRELLNGLVGILDEVKGGRSNTIFISGEPGIGKTRLLHEIEKIASSKDFLIFHSACKPGDSTPYSPFRRAFKDRDDTPLKHSVSDGNGEMEDRGMLAAYRTAYFYKTAEWIKGLSANRPVMVVLDDIHWADKGTLNMFHYLADRIEDLPVLFVGGYRPGDALPGDGFLDTKQQMSRKKIYSEFELCPLDMKDTGEMVRQIFGVGEVPDDFIKEVHGVTQGNPLFIKEIVLHLHEEGFVTDGFPDDWEGFKLPPLIQDVVERRTFRLSDEARYILQIGSVIGDRFSYELLKEIFEGDEMELLDAMDELLQNRLWIEEEDHLRFSHRVIKDIVYNGIGRWLERKTMHGKVAEALRGDKEVDHHTMADHHLKAEMYEPALHDLIQAAEQAEKMYSHEDAIDAYKEALSLADKVEDIDLVCIYERIAKACSLLGRYPEAREYLYKALAASKDLLRKQKIYSEISMNFEEQGEYKKALEMVERGLELDIRESKSKTRLLDKKGWIFLRLSRYQKAKEIFTQQIDTAEKIEDLPAIAQAYHNFGTLCFYVQDYEDAEKYLKKAEEIRREEGRLRPLTKTLNNMGILFESIDIDRSLRYYDEALKINDKVGDISLKTALLNNIGRACYHKAELDKAIKYHMNSYHRKKRTGDKYGISLSMVNLGLIYSEKGAFDDAIDHHKRSLEIVEEMGENFCRAINLRSLGNICKLKGDLGTALEHYQKSLEASEECGDKAQIAETYAAMGELYVEEGSVGRSEEFCVKALEITEEIRSVREEAIARRTLGRAYLLKGDKEKGLEELKSAEYTLEKSGFELELAKTRLYLGKFLKDEERISSAKETFQSSGMDPWLNMLNN